MRYKKIIAIMILFCFGIAHAYELPDLGEHSSVVLSPKEEQKYGKEFMQDVRRSVPICNDTIINEYIKNLGTKLVAHTDGKDRKFNFFVVQDSNINAFAGPNANIGINTGLILAMRSENELAAVMAHEISHVTQHHIERMFENATATQIPALAALAAAVILGATTNSTQAGDLASGAAMASMGGTAQHFINFTRDNEAEADHIGMQTLYKSGFDPMGMPNAFEHLEQFKHDNSNNPPAFLLDHPVTAERIADAKDRANQYPKANIPHSKTFDLIKIRALLLTSQKGITTLDYFKHQNGIAMQYGYTLAQLQNRQLAAAEENCQKLLKDDPNEILFQMLDAQILLAKGQTTPSLTVLKKSLAAQPNYYPLVIQYALTLVYAKQYVEASSFLKQKTIKYSDDSSIYRLLADTQAKAGKKVDAYQSKAKSYEIDGQNRQAVLLLQQALKLPQITANDKAAITAKVERLKQKVLDDKRNKED